MKNIFIVIACLSSMAFSEVRMHMHKSKKEKQDTSSPIKKPNLPVYQIRPIINTGIVYQDNYYNKNYVSNCQQYIDLLAQKDNEILALRREVEKLKSEEQEKFTKRLKKSYEAELEAFENRKSSINTKNSVTISAEPVK